MGFLADSDRIGLRIWSRKKREHLRCQVIYCWFRYRLLSVSSSIERRNWNLSIAIFSYKTFPTLIADLKFFFQDIAYSSLNRSFPDQTIVKETFPLLSLSKFSHKVCCCSSSIKCFDHNKSEDRFSFHKDDVFSPNLHLSFFFSLPFCIL